jgi:hypothetical protein
MDQNVLKSRKLFGLLFLMGAALAFIFLLVGAWMSVVLMFLFEVTIIVTRTIEEDDPYSGLGDGVLVTFFLFIMLTILIGWIPVFGWIATPLVAGYMGGKSVSTPKRGFQVGAIAALLLASIDAILSSLTSPWTRVSALFPLGPFEEQFFFNIRGWVLVLVSSILYIFLCGLGGALGAGKEKPLERKIEKRSSINFWQWKIHLVAFLSGYAVWMFLSYLMIGSGDLWAPSIGTLIIAYVLGLVVLWIASLVLDKLR